MMRPMHTKLILCLGNPGSTYQATRHNVGWLFGDFLAKTLSASELTDKKKFQALVRTVKRGEQQIIIAYPTTFMNDSGLAAAAIAQFYQLEASVDILVIHDDLDLELGRYKLTHKLPRTHNGLASVSEHLGTRDFACLRLGIDDRHGSRVIPALKYVLMPIPETARQLLETQVFPRASQEVIRWL